MQLLQSNRVERERGLQIISFFFSSSFLYYTLNLLILIRVAFCFHVFYFGYFLKRRDGGKFLLVYEHRALITNKSYSLLTMTSPLFATKKQLVLHL